MEPAQIRARNSWGVAIGRLAVLLACTTLSTTGCGAILGLEDTPRDAAASDRRDSSRGEDALLFEGGLLACSEVYSPNGATCADVEGGVVAASETVATAEHPILLLTSPVASSYAAKLTAAYDGGELGLIVSAAGTFSMSDASVIPNAVVLRVQGGSLQVWRFLSEDQGNLSPDPDCAGSAIAPDSGTITIVAKVSTVGGDLVDVVAATGQGTAVPALDGSAALSCTTRKAGPYVGFYTYPGGGPESSPTYESLAIDDGT
jgi:hypothetical protein